MKTGAFLRRFVPHNLLEGKDVESRGEAASEGGSAGLWAELSAAEVAARGEWLCNETKVAELLTAAEQARGEVGLGAEGNISSSLTRWVCIGTRQWGADVSQRCQTTPYIFTAEIMTLFQTTNVCSFSTAWTDFLTFFFKQKSSSKFSNNGF